MSVVSLQFTIIDVALPLHGKSGPPPQPSGQLVPSRFVHFRAASVRHRPLVWWLRHDRADRGTTADRVQFCLIRGFEAGKSPCRANRFLFRST